MKTAMPTLNMRPPAEQVAGAGTQQAQAAEGERLSVLDSRELGSREAEVLLDLHPAR